MPNYWWTRNCDRTRQIQENSAHIANCHSLILLRKGRGERLRELTYPQDSKVFWLQVQSMCRKTSCSLVPSNLPSGYYDGEAILEGLLIRRQPLHPYINTTENANSHIGGDHLLTGKKAFLTSEGNSSYILMARQSWKEVTPSLQPFVSSAERKRR